jgi:DmsE family decaheme c-type cytochrome
VHWPLPSGNVVPAPRPSWARRAVVVAAATLFTATLWGAQDKPGAPPPVPKDDKPAQYVGSDTCQGCHEDISAAFQKNPHHEVETNKKYKYDTKACESCHGPGSKHAESAEAADIRNPAKLKPAEADRACLGCHLNKPTQVGRINGSHAKNEVACVACHSVHKNGPNGLVARKPADVNKLCAGCHSDIWASFQQPFRHRLPEGGMSCVDCHNPHGSFLLHNLQTMDANEPGCFKCHGDLAGPFAFEHAPVRLDGCQACHMPHGSPNAKMLTRNEVRFVCLECHSNLPTPAAASNAAIGSIPPGFHNLFSAQFRNCTVCHQKVHGSYVDRGLLR